MPTPIKTYTPQELAVLLIKEQGLHEGLFEFSLQMAVQVGAIPFANVPDGQMIGAAIGVAGFGLTPAEVEGPNVINAALVNPVANAAQADE